MDKLRRQLDARQQREKTREKEQFPRFRSLSASLVLLLLLPFSFGHSAGCHLLGRRAELLGHAQPSAEALADSVLAALAKRDDDALKALCLSKHEFCSRVWPELPSSHLPNVTCDWVWANFEPKNRARRRQTLAAYGGKQYSLVRLQFDKGPTKYATFRIHPVPRLVVRDESGHERELRLFGSVLEMNGLFKLVSYVVDG